jgi:hypothetical protein
MRAQSQGISPEENAFVQTVETKVQDILLAAANSMHGQWDVKIKTDKLEWVEREGHERGRPHEVRVILQMAYQPSETEREAMETRINKHWGRAEGLDPIPDEVTRVSPEFEWQIYVTAIVNFYGFIPRAKSAVVSLGYETNWPGVFFSNVRWRQLGTGAPIHTLHLGDFKWQRNNDVQLLVEDFSSVTDCRDVRTILCEVHSNEKVAETFIRKLNIAALNELVRVN